MISENYEIRPFCSNDMCDFKEMFCTYFRSDLKLEISDNEVKSVCVDITDSMISGIISLDILRVDEKSVGFICYQIDKPDSDWCERDGWGFIREIYTNCCIRRRGFGAKLVAHAENILFSNEVEHIYLTSDDADKFWISCGYNKTVKVSSINQSTIFEK
ncbi:MAG: GNAT family N-acetyltransferase [Anaerocolumna sp.]